MIQSVHKYVSRVRLSPVKAIREYCKKTCAGSPKETRLCPVSECPLYEFRGGKNLARAGIGGRQRAQKGRFLPPQIHTSCEIPTMAPKKGVDRGEAVLARPASNVLDYVPAKVEVTKGAVLIERTGNELVIRLTQEA